MRLWLFSILFLFDLIIVKADRITFEQDEDTFKKCIEDNLSKDSDLKIDNSVESIARIVSDRFLHRSYVKKQFNHVTNKLYSELRDERSYLFTNKIVPGNLRAAIRNALNNCVERKNLPRFVYEPQVLADFLDYILVDWLASPSYMITTQEGRSVLRLYAYSAAAKLMSVLRYFSMDYDVFHREIQRFWMLRAHQFYDGHTDEFRYIRHRFTTNRDKMHSSIPLEEIHTTDDLNFFMWRGTVDFVHRNSLVLRSNLAATSGQRDDDIHLSNITSAENYLQTHMNQCYRIIFFILELQLRGISSNGDDNYNGTIPFDIVPFSVNNIIWNNVAYRNYLTSLRENLEQFQSKEIKECFSSGTKEDLILFLTLLIATKVKSSSTSSTTTMTTTSTEFPGYYEGLKKGGVRARDCRKYFLPKKRFRSWIPEQNPEPHQMDNNFNCYGQIFHNSASDQLKFFKDKPTFSKLFNEFDQPSLCFNNSRF